jgi:hypothetical protein
VSGSIAGTHSVLEAHPAANARFPDSLDTPMLPAREAAILRPRFHDDLTQAQIAARVGLSQVHVSRLIRGAIGTLRRSVYPCVPVASWGAPTGLDSGEPRWRR